MASASLQTADPKPKLNYSWQDTTFDFSQELEWVDDTVTMVDSGNYSETYSTFHYEYRHKYNEYIVENRTITHTANYTSNIERVTSGNLTLDMNMNAYRVNIDYGLGVKVMWIATRDGTISYEYYIQKDIRTYDYYEEYNRHIVSHFEERDMDTHALIHEWTIIQDEPGEVNTTVSDGEEWYPFSEHINWQVTMVKPMILTVQLFNTENNNKIAWAHFFQDFFIYNDSNSDSILTVHDDPDTDELPSLYTSTEFKGVVTPFAYHSSMDWETNETVYFIGGESIYPSDKPLGEIASAIEFTPPTETSTANVSWGIRYPDFPNIINIRGASGHYSLPHNATYNEMSPINLSYGFDFLLDEDEANLDISYEIGKLSNSAAFDAAQGLGLLLPQYNFFLSNFDIDEPDAPFLSVPRDDFVFTSNDTVVAEINMGAGKKDYILHNSTEGVDTVYPSSGGSIHKHALLFSSENSFYDNPLVNCLFSLRDVVAEDTGFTVQDDLFTMETQNYPVWNGEKIVHDPSLIIHHAEPSESSPGPDAIPSYNFPLLLGVAGVMMTVIITKIRRKH